MTCSIEQAIKDCHLIFDTIAQNPGLEDMLRSFGYDAAAFAQGKQALAHTEEARNAAHVCHGQQIKATERMNILRTQVQDSYNKLTKLAKIVFAEQTDALEILGLRVGQRATPMLVSNTNRRSKALISLLDSTRIFYANLLSHPDLLAAMATVGCDEPQVSAGLAQVEELRKASSAQEMAIANAKGAVQRQKDARGEMDRWAKRFRGIAPIALRSRPEALMAMGLKP